MTPEQAEAVLVLLSQIRSSLQLVLVCLFLMIVLGFFRKD